MNTISIPTMYDSFDLELGDAKEDEESLFDSNESTEQDNPCPQNQNPISINTESPHADSHDSDSYDVKIKRLLQKSQMTVHLDENLNSVESIHDQPIQLNRTKYVPIRGGTSSPASLDDSGYEPRYTKAESTVDLNIDKFYTSATLSRPLHMELTLLILYIKSQKHLYHRAATYYYFQQTMAILPTILLSSVATLLSAYSKEGNWVHLFITISNACIAFIIAVMRYFNPGSKAKTCAFMADSLNGLEMKLNLTQHKLTEEVQAFTKETIHEVEQQMNELLKLHKVVIPTPIHYIMPIISYISIFTFIRYINEYKYDLYTQYLNIKKEIAQIKQYWEARGVVLFPETPNEFPFASLSAERQQKVLKDLERIRVIEGIKDSLKEQLTIHRDAFQNIDELYSSEIRFAETHNVLFYYLFRSWYAKNPVKGPHLHPIIVRVLDTYGSIK
jgi:hypothetical protein